jgi:hypothetical protein
VSILNTFLFRQTQIQRVNLTRNSNHANPFFEHQLAGLTASFHATGFSSLKASKKRWLRSLPWSIARVQSLATSTHSGS